MEQISLFEKSSSPNPTSELTIRSFLKMVKDGYWKKHQEKVRAAKTAEEKKRIKTFSTPCVTLSGLYIKKRSGLPAKHSGYIGIDVDGKDNPKLLNKRAELESDPYIFAVFNSIGGQGFCLLFKIKSKKHYELFNGIEAYLYKEYNIVVDPVVKDPARLRYVSYDKACYYNFKKKAFSHAITVTPVPTIIQDDNIIHTEEDVDDLIKSLEKKAVDIVPTYHEWYIVGQALARLGEKGRKFFHRISQLGESYDKAECDFQFDNCLSQESTGRTDKRVNIGSLFFYAKEAGVSIGAPKIKTGKKSPSIIKEHQDSVLLSLSGTKLDRGVYVYHLWQFKVTFKKDEDVTVECLGLNPEAVSDYLYNHGIRRSTKTFYKIINNIVEVISWDSIMDIIVQEGVRLPKDFKITWDNISEPIIRKNILNKVQSFGRKVLERELILKEFTPDDAEFVKDTEHNCYLFFNNGIVEVTKSGFNLKDYKDIQGYVWKENINQRDFKQVKKKSLIQTILENAIGKQYIEEVKTTIGYMVHTFIYGEGTEIVFCIDRNVGDLNEGGNGKDFFKQIVGNVRKAAVVPGKSLNIQHQFSWERVDRDTQIVWIEDLGKHIKMEMLYNLNNGISVRKMHTPPFTVKCKIGISLQHLINMEGSSDQRRQIFLIFSDYYSQRGGIGKAHNDRNIFGENWTGWDEYYSLIVECLQLYLKRGVVRMDIAPLLDLRRQELSDGSFENLEQGTWYSTEGAIELCWGKETVINTETFISFRKKLSQWAKLSGLTIEAERKSIKGKQQKAIRLVAPMKMIGGKLLKN